MDILMPQLGETVTEGTVSLWVKAVGDSVQPGDPLFEIETDKSSMEIPATCAGVLSEIRVAKGAVVAVGTVVGVITEAGTSAQAAPAPGPAAVAHTAQAAAIPPTSATPPVTVIARAIDPQQAVVTPARNFGPARRADGVVITPLARRLASQNGVDVTQLTGSGPHGRIMARDVTAERSTSPARPMPASATAADILALYADVPQDVLPVDGMRRAIARRLLESKQMIPHFYLTVPVLLDALNALRSDANVALAARSAGQKLSVTDLIIKALAVALQQVPEANVIWAEDRILQLRRADIGIAVAIQGGLVTPVIRDAGGKSVTAISTELKSLSTRARDRKLQPAEYQGGSIAISNLGMYGVQEFSAIINPPQSAILAVGAAQRVAVETADGGVRFASQLTVTLSCDHRAIDGAVGARLLGAFKAAIEQPLALLL
jgi:pyruvate dehydrogenase E2 component (dihydrolipoamide acetyltransferase)